MNVEQTVHTILYAPPRKSIMLLGNHGLGKSSVVHQVAARKSYLMRKPFYVIDFRLAQCEPGDLIGMMRHMDSGEVTRQVYDGGVLTERKVLSQNFTLHDLADWFPTDQDSCGFLFLDELFKAPRDVQNAVLELSLDYRFHFQSLPIGWTVISANNDDMSVYSGAFAEPALFDRWLKIPFKPTVAEWLTFAKGIGAHKAILQYIENHPLDLAMESYSVGTIAPSPRAWIHLSDWIQHMAHEGVDPIKDEDYFVKLAMGYLGEPTAINLSTFIKMSYKMYTPEQIVEDFPEKFEEELKTMDVTEITFYTGTIIDYLNEKKIEGLSSTQSDNLYKYMKAVPREIASDFWAQFIDKNRVLATRWYRENKKVMTFIKEVLDKKENLARA